MAPMTQAAEMSAPVLRRWTSSSSVPGSRRPSAARSSACPPIMPPAPAAAKTRWGRARLPVESRLEPRAAGTGPCPHPPARMPQDWSPASTRARASARYATTAPSGVEVFDPDITRLIGEDLLHLRLGGGEALARLTQPLDPLLEQLERGVEIEVLALEPTHDLLEPLELLGEVEGVAGARHQASVTRASTVPSVTRRRNGSAGVNCATRFNTRPCSSRAS